MSAATTFPPGTKVTINGWDAGDEDCCKMVYSVDTGNELVRDGFSSRQAARDFCAEHNFEITVDFP